MYNPYETEISTLSPEEAKTALRKCSNRNSALFMMFFLIFYIIYIPISIFLGDYIESQAAAYAITFGLEFLVSAPIVVAVGNRNNPHKFRTFFHKPDASPGFIIKWIVIGYGLAYIVNYVFYFLFMIISIVTGQEFSSVSFATDNSPASMVVMFTAMAFLAPFFEELMFRGTLLTHTLPFGKWFAIVVTGVFFGLYHMNYAQLFYASALGIIMAFLAVKTKSILTSMLLHFTVNSISAVVSTVMSYSGIYENLDKANDMSFIMENIGVFAFLGVFVIFNFTMMIVGLILFIIEIATRKDTFKFENPCPQLSAAQKTGAYFSAPVTIIAVVAILVMTVLRMFGIL